MFNLLIKGAIVKNPMILKCYFLLKSLSISQKYIKFKPLEVCIGCFLECSITRYNSNINLTLYCPPLLVK